MSLLKKILLSVTASLVILALLFLFFTNALIYAASSPHVLNQLNGTAPDYVLILGAGINRDGSPGRMLRDRLNTAIFIYRHFSDTDAAPTLIVSGDRREGYDEVSAMTAYLLAMQVPAEKIIEDPTGFSTADSAANLTQFTKEASVIVVTQEYHLYRALYLIRSRGINASGYAAPPCNDLWQTYRDQREILACAKDALFTLFDAS